MKSHLLFGLIFLLTLPAFQPDSLAQTESNPGARQNQPMIMVIPYTKEGQDLRTILDSFLVLRVATIKIQEAFNNRGFTTVDFLAKTKALSVDKAIKDLSQSDLKSRLIESSGADIYIEVEAAEQRSGSGNSVRLNIVAYDAFTGRNLASKTSDSGKFYTDMFDSLVERCLYKKEGGKEILLLEDFLNTIQGKFDEMHEIGRAVRVIYTLDGNSMYTFRSEVGNDGDELADFIIDWIEEHAYKHTYSDPRKSDKELLFDEVFIPLKDIDNRNYSPAKFAREIRRGCNKIVPADDTSTTLKVNDDVRGGTIYITLQ